MRQGIGVKGLAVAACLAFCAAPALAEETVAPAEACPDVYGVWETAYVIGAIHKWSSKPEPLASGEWWGGLLVKAYISRDKAGLVWMKGDAGGQASSVYRRDKSELLQGDDRFFGYNAGGAQSSARIIDGDLLEIYPGLRCFLRVGEHRKGATVEGPGQTVIMRKVK